MKIAGEYTFDAPQPLVWQALRDPDVLASIMPGGEGFAEIGENEYQGHLNVKVGPVQGKFTGNIKLSDIVEMESYTMTVDGKGAPGFVKAAGGLTLTAQGEKTHISYQGDAQVGGRIASVGQRLMDSSAKSIIRQSLDALNAYLKVQVAAQAVAGNGDTKEETAAAAPTFTPPSQTSLAVNVAKDVAGDLIPPQYRPILIGLGILLLLLIVYFILR
jgi:uncharacterized protein